MNGSKLFGAGSAMLEQDHDSDSAAPIRTFDHNLIAKASVTDALGGELAGIPRRLSPERTATPQESPD